MSAGTTMGALGLAMTLNCGVFGTQLNTWTNVNSGSWEDPYWSLGILPGPAQSVTITNSGSKTITIDNATGANDSASLTVNDLTVTGENELLLRDATPEVPLHIVAALTLSGGGTLVNLKSGVVIDNGLLRINNGHLRQNGGTISANPGVFLYAGGDYFLTNGVFQSASVDFPYSGAFIQHGGRTQISRLNLRDQSFYTIQAGEILANSLVIGAYSTFSHVSGTNRTSLLAVSATDGVAKYLFKSGLICSSNVLVSAFRSAGRFEQLGGMHVITNSLLIQGSARYSPPVSIPASYILSDGQLTVASVELDGLGGFSTFAQTNGITSISDFLQLNRETSIFPGSFYLQGGTLACGNVFSAGAGADIQQTAGAFIVTNLFSFGGYQPQLSAGGKARYVRYNFVGGTLAASNIELSAEWVIGSSAQSGRVANPGYFKMAGTIRFGNANEQLGRLTLAKSSLIDFTSRSVEVRFANSSTERWNSEAILNITNWSGLPEGQGQNQLKFGDTRSGLTAEQLGQIRFINPQGFGPGEYFAQILETGEIVPSPRPRLFNSRIETGLILSWQGDFKLQTATNVPGPYIDLPNAKSPYTNLLGEIPEQYFRLRQ